MCLLTQDITTQYSSHSHQVSSRSYSLGHIDLVCVLLEVLGGTEEYLVDFGDHHCYVGYVSFFVHLVTFYKHSLVVVILLNIGFGRVHDLMFIFLMNVYLKIMFL